MYTTDRTTESGFTLVETLVSLFIFVAAVVVLVVISASGINNANLAKNRLSANYLAQEGIELVRNMRDSEMRYGNLSWDQFVNQMVTTCGGNGCIINPYASTLDPTEVDVIQSCGSSDTRATGCQPLQRSATGGYGYGSGEETQVRREIAVRPVAGGDGLMVRVLVSWMQGSREREVVVQETLYNWVTSSPQVQ